MDCTSIQNQGRLTHFYGPFAVYLVPNWGYFGITQSEILGPCSSVETIDMLVAGHLEAN